MDQCRLLDWALHEEWVQWLLHSLTKDVPAGFASIKLDQIVRADKELWTILAQQQLQSLKPVNDTPAINERFRQLMTDPRVTMFVLPLPTSAPKPQPHAPPRKTDLPKQGGGQPGQPSKPTKRRKLTRAEKNCPDELKQYNLKLEGKGNICWNYNMGCGCSNTASGSPAKCMRGFHVCAHCHKAGHSVTTCRSKPP